MTPGEAEGLRSQDWFGANAKNGFIARHHLRAAGFGPSYFSGHPVVGICNTWSELNPCNGHLRHLAEAVKRGVVRAGGFPLEFPVFSPGEPYCRPSSMLYRNLMAIDVEESVRANPLDAVVLLTGCDKTTPAGLMGVASTDLPAVVLTGGPMLNGSYRGRAAGSGTDVWRMLDAFRSGQIDAAELDELEGGLNRSAGHCMTMGTASTMACIAEALGMQLPGAGCLLAVDARRVVLAEETGALAVGLARRGPKPSEVMTRAAFENAIVVNAAIGGSTNAIIHLLAIARRVGVELSLNDFDEVGRRVPLLVDLMPSGQFLMEDLAEAGGVPAVVKELGAWLRPDTMTVTGASLLDNCRAARNDRPEVIRPVDNPVQPAGNGTAVLFGTLAPRGAVIKVSAASPGLVAHRGPALVFDRIEDYLAVVDDSSLAVTPETVIIVRNCGPRGYPGMPEVGNLPLPRVMLERGVIDMVRISDARMSGTAYGTCVLHTAPEAAIGGPLGLVESGDMITLDVARRRLDLEVDDSELAQRSKVWVPPSPVDQRGWTHLYVQSVLQADEGADLDFLVGSSGHATPRAAF